MEIIGANNIRRTRFHFPWILLITGYCLLITLPGCVDTPSEPKPDNPIDANNPESGGDPYQLQAEIANGGIQLTWQVVDVPGMTGYNVYRRDNNSSFSRLTQVSATSSTYTDRDIQNGHRYEYYVVSCSTSGEGDASSVATVEISTDPIIYIEGENVDTTLTRDVTLTIIAFGAQKMLLSNSSDFADAQWESFQSTKNWQLRTGEGSKNVYLQVIQADGDTSDVVHDTINPAPLNPVLIVLPDEKEYINYHAVELSMPGVNATEMRITNGPDSTDVPWRAYEDRTEWELSQDDGMKRVYVWFRHDFFETNAPAIDTIGVDTQVEISSFDWTSTGGDTLVPGDQVSFELEMVEDALGVETGGSAVVTVQGWDDIPLTDQGDGSYTGSYTLTVQTPEVADAPVSISFTDRAGNGTTDESDLRLTADWLSAGDERTFPLGNSGESIVMCWIPPGDFQMGAYDGEQNADHDEYPQHSVTISQGFWMGKYEVTQAQWEAVVGENPAHDYGVGDDHPVYYVSWNDIYDDLLPAINATEDGNPWRLPSEAEWEYACRAGSTTRFYWGDDPNYTDIDDYAVYRRNNRPDNGITAEVGTKLPNGWGLYDMSGNVWEWCEDWYHDFYGGAPTDGSAWNLPHGSYRVLRGGSWHDSDRDCRSASRFWVIPYHRVNENGFRVVRSSP